MDSFEGNIRRHRLIEQEGKAHENKEGLPDVIVQEKLDRIDAKAKEYMAHAEAKCRRIKSGCILFSPESSIWIR